MGLRAASALLRPALACSGSCGAQHGTAAGAVMAKMAAASAASSPGAWWAVAATTAAAPGLAWPSQLAAAAAGGPCLQQQWRLNHTVRMVLLQVRARCRARGRAAQGRAPVHLPGGRPRAHLRRPPETATCPPSLPAQDHPKLGRAGEVVTVKAGYARHSLFPKRLGDYAVPGVLRRMRVRRRRLTKEQPPSDEPCLGRDSSNQYRVEGRAACEHGALRWRPRHVLLNDGSCPGLEAARQGLAGGALPGSRARAWARSCRANRRAYPLSPSCQADGLLRGEAADATAGRRRRGLPAPVVEGAGLLDGRGAGAAGGEATAAADLPDILRLLSARPVVGGGPGRGAGRAALLSVFGCRAPCDLAPSAKRRDPSSPKRGNL
jgi:hypothetical protein